MEKYLLLNCRNKLKPKYQFFKYLLNIVLCISFVFGGAGHAGRPSNVKLIDINLPKRQRPQERHNFSCVFPISDNAYAIFVQSTPVYQWSWPERQCQQLMQCQRVLLSVYPIAIVISFCVTTVSCPRMYNRMDCERREINQYHNWIRWQNIFTNLK